MLPCLLLEILIIELQHFLIYFLRDEKQVIHDLAELRAYIRGDGVFEVAAIFSDTQLILTQVDLLGIVSIRAVCQEKFHVVALSLQPLYFCLDLRQPFVDFLIQ